MIVPGFLQKGDKIQIVSPAGKVSETPVLKAKQWFEEKGFVVELGKNVFEKHYQFAGTDIQRLNDLQTALDDKKTKVILCSRGGYGTVRILEKLDFSKFKKHPKWLVGYSDITMLLTQINKLGIASIHGSMPPFFFDENNEPGENLSSLINLLEGKSSVFRFSASSKRNKTGSARGELVGGNLSIICSLLGTNFEIDTAGKILFIEEIDEYLYHIDRMMHQLKLAGKLDQLRGLIVGDFTGIKDNDSPFGQTLEEIILKVTEEFTYPVCFGLTAGHGKKNLALPFGVEAQIKVSAEETLLRMA